MELRKPRVFIASSAEGLRMAEAINGNLDHDAVPTIWKSGTFHLSSNTVDDLVKKAAHVDFAVFLFTPDDIGISRDKQSTIVRDNVVFELGLFIGALGKERCFIVRPRGVELYLPSDLLGMTAADYAVDRGDDDWFSATTVACTQIKNEMKRLGPLDRVVHNAAAGGVLVPAASVDISLSTFDIKVLGVIATASISDPDGAGFYSLRRAFDKLPDSMITLALAKIMKLGYVEKSVKWDEHGESNYFMFQLTDEGMQAFIMYERHFVMPLPPSA